VTVLQKTLKNAIRCRGVGLHGGRDASLVLKPAPADHGIVFRRVDLEAGRGDIPARWDRVVDTQLCTRIANEHGAQVATIEHLMAALAGSEIDNALIEVDGPEVPIMDGSSAPFVMLLKCAGSAEVEAPRRAIRLLKTITVEADGHKVVLEPADDFSVDFEIEFDTPAITHKRLDVRLVNGTFNDTISRARTFGFAQDIEKLRSIGLARGGSLDNAIVVDGPRILNEDGLRFDDEFVRHKVLDCVGDLYLAGMPLLARVTAFRSGHKFNNLALRALFADESAWEVVEITQAQVARWHAKEPVALSRTA
jgi:UDP-3-O-[3-hydroxymyristoyl] N-acetylglucosamine deacetylase